MAIYRNKTSCADWLDSEESERPTESIAFSATEPALDSIEEPLRIIATEPVLETIDEPLHESPIEEPFRESAPDDEVQAGLSEAKTATAPVSEARYTRAPAQAAHSIDRIWRCRLCKHGPDCDYPACGFAHSLRDLLPPNEL